MEGMYVKKYQAGAMTWVCGNCKKETVTTIQADSSFIPEMGFYQNFHFACAHCPGTIFVNLNIPESDYEEMQFEVEDMEFHEINARKQIRDAMFAHRSDLKALNAAGKNTRRGKGKENAPHWKNQMHALQQMNARDKKRNEKHANIKSRGGRP